MKKFLILILLLIAACQPASRFITTGVDLPKTDWNDRSLFSDGLSPSAQHVLSQLPGASTYHIEYDIDDDLYHVRGVEDIRYTNQETKALGEIQVHLFPNILGGTMNISALSVDGETAAAKYELQDSLMRVPLKAPLQPGQSVIVHMEFAVTVPQTVNKNYGVLASADGVLTLAHTYPMIAVYDTKGWEAEIPPPAGDITYSDMAFYLVRVKAPEKLVIAATGREVQREAAGGKQIVTYAAGPARDFFLAASADYEVITETKNSVTINSYAPASEHAGAQMAREVAFRAIQDYSRLYAPYPYAQLNIVATPTLALGIEYPGAIAITNQIYDVQGNLQGTPTSAYMEATVAHEAGHQWFYNLVGNNQLDEPWLDESLAQFATLQYYLTEDGAAGANGFRQSLENRWASVNDASIPIDQPVSAFSDREYSAIVYGRGPLFVEALQNQMGQQAFNKFLKDYVATYSWDIATTNGFELLAEKDCSCDLTPLFTEWIYPK